MTGGPSRTLGRVELSVWAIVFAAALALAIYQNRSPILSNDSYQYLSAATNLGNGNGVSTSLVHFDSERSHGSVPAPMTTAPGGYPVAIATLGILGLEPETAALVVSATATICLLPLLYVWANWLGLTALATRAALIGLIGNFYVSRFAASALTDALFTAITFAALLLLAKQAGDLALQNRSARFLTWAVAGVLIGLTYWIRYAGLFLFIVSAVLVASTWILFSRKQVLGPLVAVSSGALVVGVGMLRNVVLVGTWKGGNTKEMFNSPLLVLSESIRSGYHLIFGNMTVARLGLTEIAFLISSVFVVSIGVRLVWLGRGSIDRRAALLLLPVALWFGIYVSAMFYLGVFSMIHFGTRILFPLLPAGLVVVAAGLTWVQQRLVPGRLEARLFVGALSVALLSYTVINLRNIAVEVPPYPNETLARLYSEELDNGETLKHWVDRHVSPGEVLVATEGQATGYVLGRKTISLVDRHYTLIEWTEADVSDVMASFNGRFLIVYPDAPPSVAPEQRESPFLGGLADGESPHWLRIVAETAGVRIFERSGSVGGESGYVSREIEALSSARERP